MPKETYFVCIEPVDFNIAWFFLGQDGSKNYKNTINTSWEHIPTKEEIINLMNLKKFNKDYMYYIIEPSLELKHKKEVTAKVISEGLVEVKDRELDGG